MAGNIPKLVDNGFQNWIKANLALNITKEGIEDAVLTEINTFHQDTLNDILSPEQILNNDLCRQCNNENILPCPTRGICIVKTGICSFHGTQKDRPCPKHVCDRLREKIKQCHNFNFPSWKNTKAENWCQNPWEIAKCYLPPDGYLCVSSIAETDINGIISVIINHSAFKNKVNMHHCDQVREVSRKVRHCPDLGINDQNLNSFIDILLTFLSHSKLLQGDSKATESVQNINKLKADSLTITTHDVTKVLQDVIHECTQLSLKEIDESRAERAKEVKTDLDKLEIVTSTSINDILNAKARAVDIIAKQVQVVLDDLHLTTEQMKLGLIKYKGQVEENLYTDIEGFKQSSIEIINQTPSVIYSRRLGEAEYQQLKNDFKTDLLAFNQENHTTIPLSSVFEEHETHLQGFYVQPPLSSIQVQRPTLSGPAEEVRKPITCLQDVFYRRSEPCSNIYLTSRAGQGKTVFCKQLVFTWCNANRNQSGESELFVNNIQIMKGFEYVFLLSLRNSTVQCDVDDMILNQIVQNLSQCLKYSPEFLQILLHREKCLILLDGLDEWSHPEPSVIPCTKTQDGLPHRKVRPNGTILTTTRSWKLSIVALKSSQIDNHIEIGYLDNNSSKQLIANAVRKILVQDDIESSVNDGIDSRIVEITSTIHSRSTPEFEMNPLILTYMIGLLCDGKSLGQSKSELFANIINFLVHRWKKHNRCNIKVDIADSAFDTVLLPAVFKYCDHIKTHEKIFLSLGQLAFKALFCENEEQSLVFKCSLVDSCLSEDEQKFCLSSGLLIQNKLPGRLTTNETRISFPHKTFQEFFAALYIYSVTDFNDVKVSVLEKCSSVEKILERLNVFVYLSGLFPERLHIMSRELSKIINSDKMITKFRCEVLILFNNDTCFETVKDLQDMYISCVKESMEANHEYAVPILQDVIITRCCNEEEYLHGLQKLTINNVKTIKSVLLTHNNSEFESQKLIRNLNLEHIQTLESLHLLCPILSDDLEQILDCSVSTLLQLSACSIKFENGTKSPMISNLSDTSVKFIRDMKNLTSLNLLHFKVSHCALESLISYLTQRTCMKQITLIKITCIDHGQLCSGFSIDLSQHVELDTVCLSSLPIVHVDINTSSLEQFNAGPLSTSRSFSSFLKCLHDAKNLRKVRFALMENEDDIDTVIDTISRFIYVTVLSVAYTDINNKVLKLSPENANIEHIVLQNVSMTSSSLEKLVGQIEKCQQSVQVELTDCTVTPAEEYERIANDIKSSGRFDVIHDGEWENLIGTNIKSFEIRTIRH